MKITNKTPLVTVIVPIYNAEKYLGETLSLIAAQTYRNLEVLMIDDGSSDSSPEICKMIEKKDNRFRYIYKENEGVSSARNLGIREANGVYIQFIDSDDRIEKNLLKECVEIITEQRTDMVIYGMTFDIEKNNIIKRRIEKNYKTAVLEKNSIVKNYYRLYENNYLSSVCNKLLNRNFIVTNQLLFDERLTNYEDLLFTIQYLNKCNTISITDKCYYHYILRQELGMSRKYKEHLNETLPLLVQKLKSEYDKFGFANVELERLSLDLQRMLWLGVANISRGKSSLIEKRRMAKEICEENWVKKYLPLDKNGNKYNDINIYLLKKKYWCLMVMFNTIVNTLRDKRY